MLICAVMTIAAAYLTSEGVVLGSDSTTTYMFNGQPEKQLLNHAQKIFEVGAPGTGRLGLCTWGNARVGTASHRTIASRLADKVQTVTTVSEASDMLAEVVAAEGKEAIARGLSVGEFGYFLGGWNPGTHSPECHRLTFGKDCALVENSTLAIGNPDFQGAPELYQRAFIGVDLNFITHFTAKLQADLPSSIPNLDALIQQAALYALAQIPHGGATDVPIREAIDLVHMYIHLTIKGFKFRVGPPVVGGPIEIGFITTDRLFRWARHKPFDSAVFQEEVGGNELC